MPLTKSALKALRRDRKRAASNRPVRSRIKTSLDAVKATKTVEALATAYSAIDKAVKKHIIHRNKAARLKAKASRTLPR